MLIPIEHDRLSELLSGYLDDMLDEHERREVEIALQDPQTRAWLGQLRANRELVASLASEPQAGLSADFTARVTAAAEASGVTAAAEASGAEESGRSDTKPVQLKPSGGRGARLIMGAMVAVAAIVLLSINFRQYWQADQPNAGQTTAQGESGKLRPEPEPMLADASSTPGVLSTPAESGDVPALGELGLEPSPAVQLVDNQEYVSDLQWTFSIAMVLHVSPTRAALEGETIEAILLDAGIRPVAPIIAGPDVENAIRDTEMIVVDDPLDSRSALYFVRADAQAIDQALKQVWADQESFPEAFYNFAMDNPQSRLMEKLAHSTGTRFTTNENFAAPVAIQQEGRPVAQLPLFKSQQLLVAKQSREQAPPAGGLVPGLGSDEMSTILILVKLPR